MKLPGITVSTILSVFFLTWTQVAIAQESILHSFTVYHSSPDSDDNYVTTPDGYGPTGTLILDASGNLYGTAPNGGSGNGGAVFEVMPGAPGVWTAKALHSFAGPGSGPEGSEPTSSLSFDSHGNLYGITEIGGTHDQGTVFELSPGTSGNWTEQVLFSFNSSGTGGALPNSGVILDAVGNLYGTTTTAGANGGGTVFELSPVAGSGWTAKELFSFPTPSADVVSSGAILTFDAIGDLYGTKNTGGANGGGFAYELTPASEGSWMEKVLYNFAAGDAFTDGSFPSGPLTFDSEGNAYGVTANGGACGLGTVYELSPGTDESWTQKILHNFSCDSSGLEGSGPEGNLLLDAAGNLYGTTNLGGVGDYGPSGTLYKLTPATDGAWTETILHEFGATPVDGIYPAAGLVVDAQGNLYGTTTNGGGPDVQNFAGPIGQGTVYKMAFTATTVATPELSLGAGTYTSAQMVTIKDATAGATIYYTTNGYQPNASSTIYTGPITVSESEQVKAIAYNSVGAYSETVTAAYTIR